jgi:hypothetical protein
MISRRQALRLLAAAPAAAVAADVQKSYFRGEPLRIGNGIQLLLDDYAVEDRWKLTRNTASVVKHMGNPVLVQDKPWEDSMGGYPGVLFDEKMGKFRMWYQCFNLSNYFSREGPEYFVGYAESEDGFHWVKPQLEGFPFGPYARTNIVTSGRGGRRASGQQVIFNPDQSDPKRRFVMIYTGREQIDIAYSPDGFHWDIVDKALVNYKPDSPNHIVWVEEEKLWYLYLRPAIRPTGTFSIPEGLRHTNRRLAVSTSPDLNNWTMPRTIFYPDERDDPDYDCVFVFRRHGVFIAFYSVMHQEKGSSENEMYIAVSRDGIHFERTWDRRPFIPRGPEGSYDHGQVEGGSTPPLDVGPNMLIYYTASPDGQGRWDSEVGVAVARLRRDRFIGQFAGDQTGYLLTRQFVIEGNRLLLNCSALPIPYQSADCGIWVEILEAPNLQTREGLWGRTVPGFGIEDCDRIVADSFGYAVTWRGRSDLSALRGRPVYLRFKMKKAELFGFQVAA